MDGPFNFPTGMRIRKFEVHGKGTTINARGRVITSDLATKLGYVYGTLVSVSETEQRKYKAMGHDISHTLVISHNNAVSQVKLKAEHVLTDVKGEKYEVQGVTSPSDLPFFSVAYLNRR